MIFFEIYIFIAFIFYFFYLFYLYDKKILKNNEIKIENNFEKLKNEYF